MKIIADQQIPHVIETFSEFSEVVSYNGREISSEKIHDADVVLLRSITQVNAELLEASQVKFVATATSGVDHIDQDYLQRKNIGFAHAKGSNARSVAEYVLSSLLVLADQYDFKLEDKTVGVVGCGEVGSRVAKLFDAIGVNTFLNDPPLKDILKKNDREDGSKLLEQYRDIQELFSADIITLHVPLSKDGPYPTLNLVDENFLEQLNEDVILLNTARGGVINESALKNHLSGHRNMKVVLDVWEAEPKIDLDLLTKVDISTPHIAGYSMDGKVRATQMVFESLCKYFKLDKEWNPKTKLPVTNRLELPSETDIDDQDAIQMAVLTSYDVRSDSIALRNLPDIAVEQRARYFDELRQEYPVRREFPATTIHMPENRKSLAGKLKRLGFNVKVFS